MKFHHGSTRTSVLGTMLLLLGVNLFGAELKTLSGHVPPQSRALKALGELPATNVLRLALGLPVRDAAGLETFLQQVSDPHSPSFRKYLTPEEFTARFGPTENDYAAVKKFATDHGLKITGEAANRMILDVSGPVTQIESALHIKLLRFQHPTEAREFFAPDKEPSVEVALPVADVSGLSNYRLPHPKSRRMNSNGISARVVSRGGSAPGGAYFGNDFRRAYVPDTTLTGAGQIIGLFEFDGFYQSDVTAYQTATGLPSIPVQTVLLDGFDGTPGIGNDEVALDIEVAMAMAPGISKVINFSAGQNGFQNDILVSMIASNMVKQFSCSWGWGGGPNTTTDNLFRQLSAQGQSFYNASGDSDAFVPDVASTNSVDNPNAANAPSSSPYITQVGGTTLNTSGGAWLSERVWNEGQSIGTGSSGGISTYYPIPNWQLGISMASNQGSTTHRNIPDVALLGDNVYTYSSNGQSSPFRGTSISAPLWAGLTALMNQQAAASGQPPVGLINSTVYQLGKSSSYTSVFHDITTGDNTSPYDPTNYFAVAGYDLCTGWGTPKGQALIDAIVGSSDALTVSSPSGFLATGVRGGPFTPFPAAISLVNTGAVALNWALRNPTAANWLQVTPTSGSLAANGGTANLTVTYTGFTTNLAPGTYTANYQFTNLTSKATVPGAFSVQVAPVVSVSPTNGFTATGPVGGPFDITSQTYTALNAGAATSGWRAVPQANWISVSPASNDSLNGFGGTGDFTVALNNNANLLPAGNWITYVYLFNQQNQFVQKLPVTLRAGVNIVANGGFETGDFTGWNLNASYTFVTNSTTFAHSGSGVALLGNSGSLGYLTQTVSTTAGQTYQLSLWLKNPANTRQGTTPNEFSIAWEGSTIYDQVNLPVTNWFNLQFTVTASANGSQLQLGFQDDPSYLGLDDVSVKPIAAP